MAEYIEREAAISAVKHAWAKGLEPTQYIEIIPAANVVPVSHGCEYCLDNDCPPLDWKYGLDHILPDYKFCPMCGRLMDGGGENEVD